MFGKWRNEVNPADFPFRASTSRRYVSDNSHPLIPERPPFFRGHSFFFNLLKTRKTAAAVAIKQLLWVVSSLESALTAPLELPRCPIRLTYKIRTDRRRLRQHSIPPSRPYAEDPPEQNQENFIRRPREHCLARTASNNCFAREKMN